jgi:dipeptidase D
MVLENIEPKIVWEIFENVLAVTPRCSQKEEKIREKIKFWIVEKSNSTGMKVSVTEDDVGNMLIKKSATKGMDSCPSLILQAHLDMVCETDRSEGFDFENNGIPLVLSEDKKWVEADGTTLGADNGIGVALALAVIFDSDDAMEHGPLEILLTVDEELEFSGVYKLDVNKLGIESRLLINLDTEKTGIITIGCAGSVDISLTKTIIKNTDYVQNEVLFIELSVSGLIGGHSGIDINKTRANSNQLVSRCLSALIDEFEIRLISWNGGNKWTTIPRDCTVLFMVKKVEIKEVQILLEKEISLIVSYFKNKGENGEEFEPNIKIEWKIIKNELLPAIDSEETKKIVYTAINIPHGVYRNSPTMLELVETSLNFAMVKSTETEITFDLLSRSINDSEMHSFRNRIAQLGKLGHWIIKKPLIYPSWNSSTISPLLKIVREEYEKITSSEVLVCAIHAGLETGILDSKIPGIQMLSIGPSVFDAHTPNEKVNVEDIQIFYKFLKILLKNVKKLNL